MEGMRDMSRAIRLLMLTSILVLFCHPVRAQVINAASCSASDVSTALSSVNQATATVNIPAGTCHWSDGGAASPGIAISYQVPSTVTSLTIQGQTTCTGSGDPTQNNLACTDGTVIIDDATAATGKDNAFLFQINFNSNPNSLVRFTGITIQAGANTLTNNGVLIFGGSSGSQGLRLDHNHFNMNTFTNGGVQADPVFVSGCVFGLVDHNLFDFSKGARANAIVNWEGSCGGSNWGDYLWSQPVGWGGGQFLFVEANVFNGTPGGGSATVQANDCFVGGKMVFRFNTFNSSKLQTHPTGGAASNRGCVAMEIYRNTFNASTSTTACGGACYLNSAHFFSSGQLRMWGNTASGYGSFVQLTDCRSPGGAQTRCGYPEGIPPNGWGNCGGSSPWDGNTNGSGYPCIDQPGRGQGDLLSGQFPSRVDTVTNKIAWPNQKLEPIYFWLNSYTALGNGNGSTNPISIDGNIWTQNQDYYLSSDQSSGTDCNGFTGATGIGCGPRSSRPSSCTTGVAWWSTDQGSWNQSGNGLGSGVLDICTSANNWADASYTPYTYPHPQTTGSSTPPPAPPTNPKATVN
jgi:hypothetical protein